MTKKLSKEELMKRAYFMHIHGTTFNDVGYYLKIGRETARQYYLKYKDKMDKM